MLIQSDLSAFYTDMCWISNIEQGIMLYEWPDLVFIV